MQLCNIDTGTGNLALAPQMHIHEECLKSEGNALKNFLETVSIGWRIFDLVAETLAHGAETFFLEGSKAMLSG